MHAAELATEASRQAIFTAAWQVRAVLTNADWHAVGYRLPVLELLATEEEHTVVGHLGPRRLEEGDVLDVRAADLPPQEEVPPAEDRLLLPHPDHPPREVELQDT